MDNDIVEASNINRQLPALTSTIGKFKADVMAARLRDINPLCRIRVIKDFYRPGDFETLFVDGFDFIADAIDSTESKADLLIEAYRHNVPVVSAMGTGNKLHPEMLEITDISKTSVCPLARSMRKNCATPVLPKALPLYIRMKNRSALLKAACRAAWYLCLPAPV